MPNVTCKLKQTLNGIEISVYELSTSSEEELGKLKEQLSQKVRKIKAHQKISDLPQYANLSELKPEFRSLLEKNWNEASMPVPHSIPWLDVMRARVTEFMAEVLLEKEFNCVFVEEAEKRLNLTASQVHSHTPGIDVPGIQNNEDGFRFVVCEVKASKDKIPSSSSTALLQDINKSYRNEKKRLLNEVKDYIQRLSNINNDDALIKNSVEFLIELLAVDTNKTNDFLLKKVIFFPFLIRSQPKILSDSNLSDFKDFNASDFSSSELKGVIWSFNQDIDTFCNDLYLEAIGKQ